MDFNIRGLKNDNTVRFTLREKRNFDEAYKQAKKSLDEVLEISLCTHFLEK